MRNNAHLFSILLIMPLLLFTYSSSSGKSLTKCAANGDTKCLEALIIKGEDINKYDKRGWTPLLWAVYYERPETVKFLVEKGANVNARTMKDYKSVKKDSTALIISSMYDTADIADLLIKNGAIIDAVNKDGRSAYSIALSNKYADMQELLEKGPSGMASKKIGETAIVTQTNDSDFKTKRNKYNKLGIGVSVGTPGYSNFVAGGYFSHFGIQISGNAAVEHELVLAAVQLDIMYLFKNDRKLKYGISLIGDVTSARPFSLEPWYGLGLASYINFHSIFIETGISFGYEKSIDIHKKINCSPMIQVGYIWFM